MDKQIILGALSYAKDQALEKIQNIQIDPEQLIGTVVKTPGVKIKREAFLRKELLGIFPDDVIGLAVETNPITAGVPIEFLNEKARRVINFDTNRVSALSFVAGIPSGIAAAATIPADIAQYFTFMLRTVQKLAYLYGFPELELDEDSLSDDTLNELLVFFGVAFGVAEANSALKLLAPKIGVSVSKKLARSALTKTTVYPIVKRISKTLGVNMTKELFASGIGKFIPVVGGIVSGGISYASFKPCAKRLQRSFAELDMKKELPE